MTVVSQKASHVGLCSEKYLVRTTVLRKTDTGSPKPVGRNCDRNRSRLKACFAEGDLTGGRTPSGKLGPGVSETGSRPFQIIYTPVAQRLSIHFSSRILKFRAL